MKSIQFLGDSLKRLREFPEFAKQDAGYQLDRVQNALQPYDFKTMPSIGNGVEELRIWDGSGTYRVIYTAKFVDIVYVLHAFQKKSQSTPNHEISIAKVRFAELVRSLK